MELTGQQIIDLGIIDAPRPKFKFKYMPRAGEPAIELSGGIEPTGYGLTIAQDVTLQPFKMQLANTIERLTLPHECVLPIVGSCGIVGRLVNKSTWARLCVWQAGTDMEAGWSGHLTLELLNVGDKPIFIPRGAPIATARFHCTLGFVEPYKGKYQNQPCEPVKAK